MKFSDLSMINLHARDDGAWSYSVYSKPHGIWRTNRGLEDPMECWDEILREMLNDEAEKMAAAGNAGAGVSSRSARTKSLRREQFDQNAKGRRPARGRGATGQASGLSHAASPPSPAKGQHRASRKAR